MKLPAARVNEPFDIGRQLIARQRRLHGVSAVAASFRDDGACVADDVGIVAGAADQRNSAQAAVVQSIGTGAAVQNLVDRAGCQGIGAAEPGNDGARRRTRQVVAGGRSIDDCRWSSSCRLRAALQSG